MVATCFPLQVGQYALRWSYQKDFSVSTGDDAVWVDDVVFPILADPVSVGELVQQSSFSVYPNPGNGILNIKTDDTYEIEIRDLTGRVLIDFGTMERDSQLDCSTLRSGIYILNAINQEKEINQRIIIQ